MDQHEARAERSRSGSRLRPGCRSARGLLERRPDAARGGDLVSVTQGGHGFSTQGEAPDEAAVIRLVVAFFVRTLVSHLPLADGG